MSLEYRNALGAECPKHGCPADRRQDRESKPGAWATPSLKTRGGPRTFKKRPLWRQKTASASGNGGRYFVLSSKKNLAKNVFS